MPPAQSTDKTLSQAKKAAGGGDWLQALSLYRSVLKRFPKNKKALKALTDMKPKAVPALLKTAQQAQAARNWPQATETLRAAATLAPELTEISQALAACQFETGQIPAALRTAERILKRKPGDPGALNVKGRALREMGRGDEAGQCLEAALGHPETDARTLTNLGILARAQGDRQAAAGYYQQALDLEPDNPALHSYLSQTLAYQPDTPHLSQMRACLEGFAPNAPSSAPLHFAMFRALDDLDDRNAAMTHLDLGNRLLNQSQPYDFQQDARPYALSRALFKAPLPAPSHSRNPGPVFVTGLPRTGTTLVERILSQAPDTQACGELTVVQNALGPLLRNLMARENRNLTESDIASLGETVQHGMKEYSDGSPVQIDKMPLNFRWIGYICAALPDARIVHVARDPMAVAWSLYRHAFVGAGNGFANDPANIARFMVLHRDLMAHWHSVCPDRIFELNYADLVGQPEATTRALARATGLEWNSDWLHPEKAKGQILTASADQARRPIYADSDEGWKRYEPHLSKLKEALEQAGLV